jgi:ankyrin repeat protein
MSNYGRDQVITYYDVQSIDLLRQKLASGVDVNRPATEMYSPLGLAARDANVEACRLLLDSGADPDRCGVKGACPLSEVLGQKRNDDAAKSATVEVVKLLLEFGANPDGNLPPSGRPIAYYSPIFQAAQYGHYEAIGLLAEHGNIDVKCYSGSERAVEDLTTPLDWAVLWKHEETAIALLRNGASGELVSQSQRGLTAFQHAAQHYLKKIVEYGIREGNEDPTKLLDGSVRVNVSAEMKNFMLLIWYEVQAQRTELTVHDAIEAQPLGEPSVVVAKNNRGMSPL